MNDENPYASPRDHGGRFDFGLDWMPKFIASTMTGVWVLGLGKFVASGFDWPTVADVLENIAAGFAFVYLVTLMALFLFSFTSR